MSEPSHYSSKLGKYIHLSHGLLENKENLEKINSALEDLWPNHTITQVTSTTGDTHYEYKSATRNIVSGTNRIIYGAPGTGKSYSVNEEIKREGAKELSTTTVFHADTQYSDFAGTLKPQTKKNGDGETVITYEFQPGPFTNAYIKAVTNPSKKVYLVIEEINRAPAAAVFGEIFQLLDRNATGESTYSIKPADSDMLAYIESQTGRACTELRLPSNLFLSATMNSSDQAVMPMDTAFKRRWSFRYTEIDFTAPGVPDAEITLFLDEHGSEKQGNYTISWKDFAEKVINHMLKEFGVAEDRSSGPSSSPRGIGKYRNSAGALRGKLFPYIWDDVLRHLPNERARLFGDVQTYGDLYARFDQEQSVFRGGCRADTKSWREKESGQDESA